MKYRILITDVLGYKIASLQKGFLFFWWTIKQNKYDETISGFILKCLLRYDKYIKVKNEHLIF